MILLDTCALLFLAADQTKLSLGAKEAIRENAGELFLSSISAFEIAVKIKRKKLELPLSPSRWIAETLEYHGIQEIPVNKTIAIKSVELAPLHNDPCDRIIIATAMENSMDIVTSDTLISQYKTVKVIW